MQNKTYFGGAKNWEVSSEKEAVNKAYHVRVRYYLNSTV
jgi:hypothetical protein